MKENVGFTTILFSDILLLNNTKEQILYRLIL